MIPRFVIILLISHPVVKLEKPLFLFSDSAQIRLISPIINEPTLSIIGEGLMEEKGMLVPRSGIRHIFITGLPFSGRFDRTPLEERFYDFI